MHSTNLRSLLPLPLAPLGLLCGLVIGCADADPPAPVEDAAPRHQGAALDAHIHVMSQALMDLYTGGGVAAPGAADIIARLDEAQIERAIVIGYGYLRELPPEMAAAENDYAAAQVALHPDRLIGLCGVNPLREGAAAEIDRCVDQLGMTGVKIHIPNSMLDLRQPDQAAALGAVFDRAVERDLPVLMHAGAPLGLPLDTDAFMNLGMLIAQRPTMRLVMAHCTNDSDRDEMEVWMAGRDAGFFNPDTLFVDTSSCLEFYKDAPRAQKELIVWRLRTWGLDHVLFASDYDYAGSAEPPAAALATLRSYPFTAAELDTILANAGSAWLGR